MAPTVTAAITTHDRAALVVQALESVLAQTWRDLEVVVVDNGSTDGTGEALEPYLDRIRYVRQENRGRAGARNRALTEARGRFVAFLDSDDLWLPDKLERQVAVLEREPSVGLVHGYVEMVDEEGRPLPAETAAHRRLFGRAHRHGATYAGYALETRCLTSTIILRAEAVARVGPYDAALALEDLDLYLRLLRETGVRFLDGPPLARYRVHPAQTGGEELARGHIAVNRKHLALLGPGERLARRNLYLSLAGAHHVLGEQDEARRATLQAARVDPRALLRPDSARRLAASLLPHAALLRLRRLRAAVH